jgi:putative transposase
MKIEYRRKLPHKFYLGYTFFITWNIKGAIPAKVIEQMKYDHQEERQKIEEALNLSIVEKENLLIAAKRKYLVAYNEHLDIPHPECPLWLTNQEVAKMLAERLHEFDGKYYRLLAYCIMGNHVHAVFDFSIQLPKGETAINDENYKQVDKIMKLINGASAVRANRILKREGRFWEIGYFDRFIRDEKHLYNAINYTLQNPVKIGLCKEWSEYAFSYLSPEIEW